ncbi:MAG: type I DNA topoisomerase [Deltaproteobacteria bacterium]|nr:MAG: type I DNA topoisomerase [Deltaproteobacteria bacterium]
MIPSSSRLDKEDNLKKMEKKRARGPSRAFPKIPDTAGKQLVVVESPAKARTINKYLGSDYVVAASVGHVRDLPEKNPKGVKDPVPGVDLSHNFTPSYEVIKGKAKTVTELKSASKAASGIWLATDLDREGEAIAWHLAEALTVKPEHVKRVVFNAITISEIEKAFRNPRPIDMDKVNAQQARRILDRIVGYQVSPLLWKKVSGGLSAGRVQSVAVRLVVEREREIEAFIPKEYWKLTAYFTPDIESATAIGDQWHRWLNEAHSGPKDRKIKGRAVREKTAWLAQHNSFAADLIEIDTKKFEPKDSDSTLEAIKATGFSLVEKIETENPRAKGPAQRIIRLKGSVAGGPTWHVKSTQTKRVKSRPFAPFITSTLQQTAANQLGFSAHVTMRTAQELYEGVQIGTMGSVGLITYMRTDSTHLAPEAIAAARAYIASSFGSEYLPPRANAFASSNKKAQEAHEAIRPTDVTLFPEQIRSSLSDRQYRLYKIIWERFVASQMTDAQWDNTTVLISGLANGKEYLFRATGRILVFEGYHKVAGLPTSSDEVMLPKLVEKQQLAAFDLDPTQNFTSPPPRYTEASLVRKLEAEGIGRPSTYAQIIQVIQNRKYVEKRQNLFYATDLGSIVTDKLIEAFPEIMEVGYTRDMEQQLDDIEEKHADWIQMLETFYGPFKNRLDAAYEDMGHAKAEIQPASHTCPECGSQTVYRFGRNGRFLSCSRYPHCTYASPIDRAGNPLSPELTDVACPECGAPMLLRKGRYGPFLSCSTYPDCKGIVNLDKKGHVTPPKIPPLLTDLTCPKCGAPLNLRRGSRGPWLSCSTFPKCTGRLGWGSLDKATRAQWEEALGKHEKALQHKTIRRLDGTPIGEGYKPQTRDTDADISQGL